MENETLPLHAFVDQPAHNLATDESFMLVRRHGYLPSHASGGIPPQISTNSKSFIVGALRAVA